MHLISSAIIIVIVVTTVAMLVGERQSTPIITGVKRASLVKPARPGTGTVKCQRWLNKTTKHHFCIYALFASAQYIWIIVYLFKVLNYSRTIFGIISREDFNNALYARKKLIVSWFRNNRYVIDCLFWKWDFFVYVTLFFLVAS